jgi:hypothetical protein
MTDNNDDALITTAHLHEAAYLVEKLLTDDQAGLSIDAIPRFIASSTFDPPMEKVALSYGILVGVLAVKMKNSERSIDDGNRI